MRFVPLQLFGPEHRRNTIVGLLFGLGSLLAIWTTNIWLPTILSLMVQKSGIYRRRRRAVRQPRHHGLEPGRHRGYIAFGFIADIVGRRATVVLYAVGTIAAGLTLYLGLTSYEPYYPVVLPIFGFFVFGTFTGFAVYLPELFPTHVRSTAVGFTTGARPRGHQLRPAGGRTDGRRVGGSFNKVTAFMTLLRAVEHHRDVPWARDEGAGTAAVGRKSAAHSAGTPAKCAFACRLGILVLTSRCRRRTRHAEHRTCH